MRWCDCLNYSVGPNVIVGPFPEKGGGKSQRRGGERNRGESSVTTGFEGYRGPWPKKCGWPLKAGEDERVDSFLEPLEKNTHPPTP